MNRYSIALNSYGTIYGTVGSYTSDGSYIGAINITPYGIFFVVRDSWDFAFSKRLFQKSVGTGVTITNGSSGLFSITIQPSNVNINPSEYVYECFVNPAGNTFVDGTTQLKSIGSGIFEISKGAKYGTI